jgi:hypothetical protein
MKASAIDPLFISRGRILEPYFTLRFHQIKSCQTIIAYVPSAVQGCPSARAHVGKWRPLTQSQTMQGIAHIETLRMLDTNFTHWQAKRELPNVMKQVLRAIEEADSENAAPETGETVVRPATAISDRPLRPHPTSSEVQAAAGALTRSLPSGSCGYKPG